MQVDLIYSECDRKTASNIEEYLVQNKCFTYSQKKDDGFIRLYSDELFCDCAIIIVSDSATLDIQWQQYVRNLPTNIRLISVGVTEAVDYNDSEIIPERIEEVNSILINEKMYGNLWRSLTADFELYEFWEDLEEKSNKWHADPSDIFLMSKLWECRKKKSILHRIICNEEDPEQKAEYQKAEEYLKASWAYIKKEKISSLYKFLTRSVYIVCAGIIVTGIIFLIPFLNRANYATAVLHVEGAEELAPINTVKLLEGISNPFLSNSSTRNQLESRLIQYLDMNWYNTPIGTNYKYALNNAAFDSDERYLWTALGNGNIAKWDTYTGQIGCSEHVSENPLYVMCRNETSQIMYVLDSKGNLFVKNDGKTWNLCCELPLLKTDTQLRLCANNDVSVVVSDSEKLYYFSALDKQPDIYAFDRIYCFGANEENIYAIIQKSENTYLIKLSPDGIFEQMVPLSLSEICAPCIFKNRLIGADDAGNLFEWNFEKNMVKSVGITLSFPICVGAVNDDEIVYGDRNTGIHLYNTTQKIDLGEILYPAVDFSQVFIKGNTVCVKSDGRYFTEDVNSLLPTLRPSESRIIDTYTSQSDDSGMGVVKSIRVKDNYIVECSLSVNNQDYNVIFDGASRLFVGENQKNNKIAANIADNTMYYSERYLKYTGYVTVTGILSDGRLAVIGTSDGSLYEMKFNGNTGACFISASKRIPTHAAIEEIILCEDGYYIKDVAGNYWKARTSFGIETYGDYFEYVKNRLHCAAGEDLLEIVSPELAKKLDLKEIPGGGTEVWE